MAPKKQSPKMNPINASVRLPIKVAFPKTPLARVSGKARVITVRRQHRRIVCSYDKNNDFGMLLSTRIDRKHMLEYAYQSVRHMHLFATYNYLDLPKTMIPKLIGMIKQIQICDGDYGIKDLEHCGFEYHVVNRLYLLTVLSHLRVHLEKYRNAREEHERS